MRSLYRAARTPVARISVAMLVLGLCAFDVAHVPQSIAGTAAAATISPTAPATASAPAGNSVSASRKNVDLLLGEVARAVAALPEYSAQIAIFERQGERSGHMGIDFSYRRPTDITAHITTGKNKGATIIWTGGPDVSAHRGSGFMALFSKKFSLHDPTTTSVRGSSIDQLRFDAILENLQATRSDLSMPLQRTGPGEPIVLIRTSPKAAAGEFSREEFRFSPTTHLPIEVLGYEGQEVVRDVTFADVHVVAYK